MDIARLNMADRGNAGAWIDIKGPDGSPTDIRFQIRGARSDAVRQAVEKHQQAMAEAVRAKKADADFEALARARDAELAAAAVIDWTGMEEGGQPLPCTPDAARRLLTHPGYDWLAAQVFSAAQDAAVFLKP